MDLLPDVKSRKIVTTSPRRMYQLRKALMRIDRDQRALVMKYYKGGESLENSFKLANIQV